MKNFKSIRNWFSTAESEEIEYPISKDKVTEIAKAESFVRNWTWLEPVNVRSKQGYWEITTNVEYR